MARRVVAEFLGTALLLVAVVGSGIATSTDGPASAQLFQHAIVVGAALTALILTFGPVSGGHFNPAVTVADAWFGGIDRRDVGPYVIAQVAGAVAGVLLANGMFSAPLVALGTTARATGPTVVSEVVATAGLLAVIFGVVRTRSGAVAPAVGAWIAAAIYFTSSTSFANPAVTLARALTDTWTGIAPASVAPFLLAQAVGTAVAVPLVAWLLRPDPDDARNVVVPHEDDHPDPRPAVMHDHGASR